MKSLLILFAAAIVVALSSCANTYTGDFAKSAAAMPRPPVDAEGPWLGTWKSDVNGHTGPLWCIVKPSPDRPGAYDFRYRAGWGTLQFGDYTHTTPAEPAADGSLKLEGKMTLPRGFGEYNVEGLLTHDSFTAKYQSEGDRGTMTLKRPALGAGD